MADPFGMDWKKINYCLIRPKFGKIVISKEAKDRARGILNFWQYNAFSTFRVI
jgi:hypothetical protein